MIKTVTGKPSKLPGGTSAHANELDAVPPSPSCRKRIARDVSQQRIGAKVMAATRM